MIMNRGGVITIALLAFAFNTALGAARADSILDKVKKAGVVRIGSGTTTPPMNYLDEKGNWTGFDVDFCRASALYQ